MAHSKGTFFMLQLTSRYLDKEWRKQRGRANLKAEKLVIRKKILWSGSCDERSVVYFICLKEDRLETQSMYKLTQAQIYRHSEYPQWEANYSGARLYGPRM